MVKHEDGVCTFLPKVGPDRREMPVMLSLCSVLANITSRCMGDGGASIINLYTRQKRVSISVPENLNRETLPVFAK